MLLRILAVGDVVSEAGLAYLERRLRRLQREHNVDFSFVIVSLPFCAGLSWFAGALPLPAHPHA